MCGWAIHLVGRVLAVNNVVTFPILRNALPLRSASKLVRCKNKRNCLKLIKFPAELTKQAFVSSRK